MAEYPLIKLTHVLAVIVAVGANVTYAFWLARAGADRDRILYTIQGIRWLDRRLALPGYLVAFVTGVAMVLTGMWRFDQGWIAVSIALYLLTALAGFTLFAPAIRRQIAAAEADPRSDAYEAAARQTMRLCWLTVAIVGLIVVLMVTKPF